MSYNPTIWHSGDTVTAEKLNKLEQGAADAVPPSKILIIDINMSEHPSEDQWAIDKTAAELYDAIAAGIFPMVLLEYSGDAGAGIDTAPLSYYVKDDNGMFNIFYFSHGNGDFMLCSSNIDAQLTFTLVLGAYVPVPEELFSVDHSGLLLAITNGPDLPFNVTAEEVINALNNNVPVCVCGHNEGAGIHFYFGLLNGVQIGEGGGDFFAIGRFHCYYEGDTSNYVMLSD